MDLDLIPVAQRKPLRITSTFPAAVAAWLSKEATTQGRSVSNLIAHLIEVAMRRELEDPETTGRAR